MKMTFPVAMFGGLSRNSTTTSSGGTATDQWNAAIEAKVRAGLTRPQATVAVIKEQPRLQAAYIEEFRKQAAMR